MRDVYSNSNRSIVPNSTLINPHVRDVYSNSNRSIVPNSTLINPHVLKLFDSEIQIFIINNIKASNLPLTVQDVKR